MMFDLAGIVRNRDDRALGALWASRAIAGLIACVIMAQSVCALEDKQDNTVQLDQIFRAWKARQESITAVRFNGMETIQIAGMFKPLKEQEVLRDTHRAVGVVHSLERLVYDGRWVKYESKGPKWAAGPERFIDYTMNLSNLNKITKTFMDMKDEKDLDHIHPQGIVTDLDSFLVAKTFSLRPLFLFCRPMDPTLGGPVWKDGWESFGIEGTESIDGHLCFILAHDGRRGMEKYWVDPLMDYVVVRISYEKDGKPIYSQSISSTAAEKTH